MSEDAYRIAGDEADPLEAWFPAYDLPAIAAGVTIEVILQIADMKPSDYVESVRFVGGFAGLELRAAEPQNGTLRLIIANPGAAAIDRAPTDLGVAFHHEVSGN